MSKEVKITTDEWQAELDRLESQIPPSNGFMTSEQIGAAIQRNSKSTRQFLKAMAEQGRLELGRIYQTRIDGVRTNIPAYRIKRKAK